MLRRLAVFAVATALLAVPSAASAATVPTEPSAAALVHTPPAASANDLLTSAKLAVHPARSTTFRTTPWAGRLWSSTLCGAAAHFYGRCNPAGWTRIQAANRIADPDVIPAGVVLRVPLGAQGTPATPAQTTRATAPRATSGWVYPLSSRGTCTSGYGYRVIYVNGRRHASFHQGVDISAPYGRTIRAVTAGTVVSAGWNSGYGRQVVLRHGTSSWTTYNHASSLLVRAGQRVGKGQAIARVGSTGLSTGNHLHVEVWTAWKDRTSPIPAFRAHGVRLC